MKTLNHQQALDTPMQDNDAGAVTVRDYLFKLLETVWHEEEGFSGKRPFGNSGWRRELYDPLVKAGHIEGNVVDDRGEPENRKDADAIIHELIVAMCHPAKCPASP